jgi:lipoate-protein ligase A
MSSEAETSLDISDSRSSQRFLDFVQNETGNDITKCRFASLHVHHDISGRSAAMNMAIDEALLERVTVPTLRFYRWQSPALSFGYFGRFADVADYQGERDLTRRWTGGGIVFHGKDLTYSILIPASDTVFAESPTSIYQKIHRVLCDVFVEAGHGARLATETGVNDPGYNCFANPVRADVMMDGRKVAGAAQRRTHRGLLQQGSIQGVGVGNRLAERFAQALSANCHAHEIGDHVLERACELAQQKYGTEIWLRKR